MIQEILQGRGFKDEGTGMNHLLLDLRHIGSEKINEHLAGIREITMKFSDLDPIHEPIPVRPVCHYMMGGIHVDIDGASEIRGLWVSGEAACVSVNGANRLGANSTAECLVWGKYTGEFAAKYVLDHSFEEIPNDMVVMEEKRIYDGIFHGAGQENPYQIKKELTDIMDEKAYVFRTGSGLAQGITNKNMEAR